MTHHSPGDVAALSTVPGVEAIVPGTAAEAAHLVRSTYANGRITYLRTARPRTPPHGSSQRAVSRSCGRQPGAAEIVLVEPFYEGTMAAQIAAALSGRPTRLLSIGVPRRVISRYGTLERHDRALGLDVAAIRTRIRNFLVTPPAGSLLGVVPAGVGSSEDDDLQPIRAGLEGAHRSR